VCTRATRRARCPQSLTPRSPRARACTRLFAKPSGGGALERAVRRQRRRRLRARGEPRASRTVPFVAKHRVPVAMVAARVMWAPRSALARRSMFDSAGGLRARASKRPSCVHRFPGVDTLLGPRCAQRRGHGHRRTFGLAFARARWRGTSLPSSVPCSSRLRSRQAPGPRGRPLVPRAGLRLAATSEPPATCATRARRRHLVARWGRRDSHQTRWTSSRATRSSCDQHPEAGTARTARHPRCRHDPRVPCSPRSPPRARPPRHRGLGRPPLEVLTSKRSLRARSS